MITNRGTIVYSTYMKLERKHGADNMLGIMQRIINNLEQEDLIRPDVPNKVVKERSEELYEEIKKDYSDGFNIKKND